MTAFTGASIERRMFLGMRPTLTGRGDLVTHSIAQLLIYDCARHLVGPTVVLANLYVMVPHYGVVSSMHPIHGSGIISFKAPIPGSSRRSTTCCPFCA